MRRAAGALVMVGLGALGLAGPARGGAGDEAREVREVQRLLAGGSPAPGDVPEALRRVLDVTVSLGREARRPAPAQAKLDAASAQARR